MLLFWPKRDYIGMGMTRIKLIILCKLLKDGRHCADCFIVQRAVCTTTLLNKYYYYPYATVVETKAEKGEYDQLAKYWHSDLNLQCLSQGRRKYTHTQFYVNIIIIEMFYQEKWNLGTKSKVRD